MPDDDAKIPILTGRVISRAPLCLVGTSPPGALRAWGKACVEAISRYGDRVIRNPTAAKLLVSLLPWKAKVLQRTFEPGPS